MGGLMRAGAEAGGEIFSEWAGPGLLAFSSLGDPSLLLLRLQGRAASWTSSHSP
jgi:hypothetical protein